MQKIIIEKLKYLMNEVEPYLDLANIPDNAPIDEYINIDSLTFATFLIKVVDTFKITTRDIKMDQLITMSDWAQLIQTKGDTTCLSTKK